MWFVFDRDNVNTFFAQIIVRSKRKRKKCKVGLAGGKESTFDNWVAFPTDGGWLLDLRNLLEGREFLASQFFHRTRVINFAQPTNRVTGHINRSRRIDCETAMRKVVKLQVFSIDPPRNKSAILFCSEFENATRAVRDGRGTNPFMFRFVFATKYARETRGNLGNITKHVREARTVEVGNGDVSFFSYHRIHHSRLLSAHSRRNSMPEQSPRELIFPSNGP